jgi:toxin ParE1/3/4
MMAPRRVLWAPRARQDLREIRRYYARTASPEVADKILREINRVCGWVAENPLARRRRDELMPGLRSAVARPYSIFYRIEQDEIQILRILHERRDFPTLFGRR